jgi:hypothetical protein
MADWKEWSEGWLKEGYYISYLVDGITYYERVVMRDFAHYVYVWPETIGIGETSEGHIPEDLEVTRGYDPKTNLNHIWQIIFGIKGQAYIYVQLPADVKRHGTAKRPWHSRELREVAHFEEWMSPYDDPSFITEHWLKRPETYRISFDAYNPPSNGIALTELKLNFFVNKVVTERIGTEEKGELTATQARFDDVLKKLSQRLIPCRPISIMPVRLPAAAPSGE